MCPTYSMPPLGQPTFNAAEAIPPIIVIEIDFQLLFISSNVILPCTTNDDIMDRIRTENINFKYLVQKYEKICRFVLDISMKSHKYGGFYKYIYLHQILKKSFHAFFFIFHNNFAVPRL